MILPNDRLPLYRCRRALPWLAALTACVLISPGPARAADAPFLQQPDFDPPPKGIFFSVTFSTDGKQVALAREEKSVSVHDWPSGKKRVVLSGHGARVWTGAFSPDGKLLASCTGEYAQPLVPGEVKLWDLATGKETATLNGHKGLVFGVTFSPDGKLLLSTSWDGTVKVWDVATGKEKATLAEHKQAVRMAVYAPDGKTFATAGFDGTVRFWDAATFKLQRTIEAHARGTQCVAFSPDGKLLATCDRPGGQQPPPGEIKLWDADSGKELTKLTGNKGHVLWVDFSLDGATLATGGGDLAQYGEVQLFEVCSGQRRANLEGHKEWVECVRFAPGGRSLVSCGGFTSKTLGEVRVWKLDELARPKEALTAKGAEKLWEALADKDAAKAYQAVLSLGGQPNVAVPLLKEKLQPAVAVDVKKIERLIADLDSDKFKVWQGAAQELEKLGDGAEPALRQALKTTSSADLKLRISVVLRRLTVPLSGPESLRMMRAVEVLEQACTPEARKLLEGLAKGALEARLTRQARAALQRIDQRDRKRP
ncbi:MAG: WD40 repeat domain-containing protein [Planctomycetes bacterium]|nr:WD40 repeat domain-containing protein [Planctomycetota bacterium]